MLRLGGCRRTTKGTAGVASCSVLTGRASSTTAGGNRYTKTHVVTENRLTKWCRRLWGLANESGHFSAGATVAQAAEAVSKLAAVTKARGTEVEYTGTGKPNPAWVAAAATAADPGANGWIASRDFSKVGAEDLISGLREVVAADKDRFPIVLVDTVWSVYDAILPPDVQGDLDHALTAERLHHFFSFVNLLTEMDFDVGAVRSAQERLSRVVAEYETALAEMGSEHEAHDDRRTTTMTVAQMERRNKAAENLAYAKSAVVSACFKARSAGSPLYYTWLRHTASTEGGIRRLMDFRKVIHFFDVECKKRVTALTNSQRTRTAAAHADDDDDNAGKDRLATPLETELDVWMRRARGIRVIDASLTFLFHDFFSKEYLIMEELSWFSTPPSLLEQIMRAEAVHPFTRGLLDMRERLQPTHHRHLFAFLHPAVVEEPLIAVQVALTKGISGSVDDILGRPTPLQDPMNTTVHGRAFQKHLLKYGPDTGDKERVDTAIFYSINSAQSALRGMDMGNKLIKRVVREIEENINASRSTRKLTPITQFSTLSPIPGYTRWLSSEVEKLNHYANRSARDETALVDPLHVRVFGACPSPQELEERYYKPMRNGILAFASRREMGEEAEALNGLRGAIGRGDVALANARALSFLLRQFLAPDMKSPWWWDHEFTTVLERPLLRSVASYLYQEKKKRNRHVLDPVGDFHISNGATLFRVNFLGNTTPQGSRESGCVMVNYWYNTQTIGDNVGNYERTKSVAVDSFILDLLKNDSDG